MSDFDIEDAGEIRPEYDDMVGYTDESDREAADENTILSDYRAARDILGDEIKSAEVDPATIDPLVFVPHLASDYDALKQRLVQIVQSVDRNLRVSFIKELITSLAGSFHKLQLEQLAEMLETMASERANSRL